MEGHITMASVRSNADLVSFSVEKQAAAACEFNIAFES